MSLYLDASVVAAVILREVGWERIVRTIGDHPDVNLSDFGFGEIVSSIAIRNRASGAGLTAAEETIDDLKLLVSDWARVTIDSRDIQMATELVAQVTLNLRLPDAIHVIVARRIGATLVTNDRQQHNATLTLGLPALNPLEQS